VPLVWLPGSATGRVLALLFLILGTMSVVSSSAESATSASSGMDPVLLSQVGSSNAVYVLLSTTCCKAYAQPESRHVGGGESHG
jgi:hypothetical protein